MRADPEPVIKLRNASMRRERDFISLFNALWYRDFPYTPDRKLTRVRAMYTAHLNGVVKSCADLLGFFVSYETGNRTDLVIETARGTIWANVELEWIQAFKESVNEIEQLAKAAHKADVSIFVGYSNRERLEENVQSRNNGRTRVICWYSWLRIQATSEVAL